MKILLTGGSRGIGAAISELLSDSHDILAPSRSELDLSCKQSVAEFCEQCPPVDALINNAGINIIKPISEVSDDDIEQLNRVNYESPLKLCRAVIPNMQSQRFGRIINISSIWGVRSKAHRGLYSGSKTGIIGLTRALARELGPSNILVNAVCPGFTDTELTRQSLTPSARDELLKDVPLGRMASPDEIARVVRFLLSDDATYITGQAITVDGGFTA